MYGFQEIITKKDILSRISQESIFLLYFSEIDFEKRYVAPYRGDREAGCWFEEYGGSLVFVDFTLQPPSMDCFKLVQIMEKLPTYTDALSYINTKMEVGLNTDRPLPVQFAYEEKTSEKKEKKEILLSIRNFNIKDGKYWAPYGISRENLIEDGVKPLFSFRIKRGVKGDATINCMEISYAYTDFLVEEGETVPPIKIYSPLSDKKYKWTTNCNSNNIGGTSKLTGSPVLVITKSYKDYRVLRNSLPDIDVVWFQNEGQIPSLKTLEQLQIKKRKKVYICFDNDSVGLAKGKMLVDVLKTYYKRKKITQVYVPIKWNKEGVKDPSDFYKYNKQEYDQFIINKIINN